ncbi:pentatricopeptide repeat-containing protein, partial [Striga asiatica]
MAWNRLRIRGGSGFIPTPSPWICSAFGEPEEKKKKLIKVSFAGCGASSSFSTGKRRYIDQDGQLDNCPLEVASDNDVDLKLKICRTEGSQVFLTTNSEDKRERTPAVVRGGCKPRVFGDSRMKILGDGCVCHSPSGTQGMSFGVSVLIKVFASNGFFENSMDAFAQARRVGYELGIRSCNFLLKCLAEANEREILFFV